MINRSEDCERIAIRNATFYKSIYYRNRYECIFWGRNGPTIKQWIRDTFGENDDLVYECISDEYGEPSYSALITPEQLTLVMLKWS